MIGIMRLSKISLRERYSRRWRKRNLSILSCSSYLNASTKRIASSSKMMGNANSCILKMMSRSTWTNTTRGLLIILRNTTRVSRRRFILCSDSKCVLNTIRIQRRASSGICIKNAHLPIARKRESFIFKNIKNDFSVFAFVNNVIHIININNN